MLTHIDFKPDQRHQVADSPKIRHPFANIFRGTGSKQRNKEV